LPNETVLIRFRLDLGVQRESFGWPRSDVFLVEDIVPSAPSFHDEPDD